MLLRLMFIALLGLVSFQCAAKDVDRHNALFDAGTKLIDPYMTLADRPGADASSPQAQKQLMEGIQALTEAVEINPDNSAAYWFIGMAYRALKDYDKATTAFGRAYDINPEQPNFAREYAYSAMCSGETKRAVEVAQAVSTRHPRDAGMLANLGLALLADGQLERARSTTRQSLDLEPGDAVTTRLMKEIKAVQDGKKPSRYCR